MSRFETSVDVENGERTKRTFVEFEVVVAAGFCFVESGAFFDTFEVVSILERVVEEEDDAADNNEDPDDVDDDVAAEEDVGEPVDLWVAGFVVTSTDCSEGFPESEETLE